MNEDLNPTRMDNFWNRLAVREGHLRNNTGKKSIVIQRYLELTHIGY